MKTIFSDMVSGSLHISADASRINSEILQNILVTFEQEIRGLLDHLYHSQHYDVIFPIKVIEK